MRFMMAAAVFLLFLTPDVSLAAPKKSTTAASVAGGTCTTGQICAADCDAAGWCSRMVCSGNKWEKRLVSCFGSFCPPKC